MRLLIHQRVFSWTDTYDIYDENECAKYFVKTEFLRLGHHIHVYRRQDGAEMGVIHQRLWSLMPCFEIEIGGSIVGEIRKEFTFFKSKYNIDMNGWEVRGDFFGWEYEVVSQDRAVMHIRKELLNFGDTYVIEFENESDELMGLLLVLAIDAANCTDGN